MSYKYYLTYISLYLPLALLFHFNSSRYHWPSCLFVSVPVLIGIFQELSTSSSTTLNSSSFCPRVFFLVSFNLLYLDFYVVPDLTDVLELGRSGIDDPLFLTLDFSDFNWSSINFLFASSSYFLCSSISSLVGILSILFYHGLSYSPTFFFYGFPLPIKSISFKSVISLVGLLS